MPRPSRTRSLRRHQRSTFSDRHTTHNRPLTSARAVCRAGIFAAVACVRAENLNSDPAVCHVSRDVGRYKSPLTSSLSHEEARHVAQERPLHSSRPIPASHAHHKGHAALPSSNRREPTVPYAQPTRPKLPYSSCSFPPNVANIYLIFATAS